MHVSNQVSNTVIALAVIVTLAVLFLAQAALGREMRPDPRALSLRQVELIGLDSNICALGIHQQLNKEGMLVTDNLKVPDAILEVTVRTNGSLRDQGAVESAQYSAVLLGAADHVLFATGGNEHARNLEQLCEDIGDDIADALDDKMNG